METARAPTSAGICQVVCSPARVVVTARGAVWRYTACCRALWVRSAGLRSVMAGPVSDQAVDWERKRSEVWVVGLGVAAGHTGAVGAVAVVRAG